MTFQRHKLTSFRTILIEPCSGLSGETFLKKGFLPNPLPKTFNINLRPTGYYPVGLKFKLKVFGREFEGKPFFKRVSLNKTHTRFYGTVLMRGLCLGLRRGFLLCHGLRLSREALCPVYPGDTSPVLFRQLRRTVLKHSLFLG